MALSARRLELIGRNRRRDIPARRLAAAPWAACVVACEQAVDAGEFRAETEAVRRMRVERLRGGEMLQGHPLEDS